MKINFFWLILILAIIFLVYSMLNITSSWTNGHEGCNGGWYSYTALNMVKYGYLKTKLGMMINTNSNIETGAETLGFFTHHPTLMPILISIFFHLFGINEWSARLVPILLNLISMFALYLICKEYFNDKVGFFPCYF